MVGNPSHPSYRDREREERLLDVGNLDALGARLHEDLKRNSCERRARRDAADAEAYVQVAVAEGE